MDFEPDALTLLKLRPQTPGEGMWYPYEAMVEAIVRRPPVAYPRFGGASPGWDNTPRRGEGGAGIRDSTPAAYGNWLRQVLASSRERAAQGDPAGRFVFINAWNEWGEGCHLEPCEKWGRGYLEETAQALAATRCLNAPPTTAE